MEFVALVDDDPAGWERLTEEEQAAAMEGYTAVAQEATAAGALVSGAGLAPTTAATSVRVRKGEAIVTDGPYAEVKESLGGYYLFSCDTRRPGPYQLQAAIAAGHAQGSDPATLVAAYEALLRLDGSPVARLNHAVAVALAGEVERGLSLADAVEGLGSYRHYHSARADLLRRLGRSAEAHAAYARALELTDDGPERRFLERRLGETAGGHE